MGKVVAEVWVFEVNLVIEVALRRKRAWLVSWIPKRRSEARAMTVVTVGHLQCEFSCTPTQRNLQSHVFRRKSQGKILWHLFWSSTSFLLKALGERATAFKAPLASFFMKDKTGSLVSSDDKGLRDAATPAALGETCGTNLLYFRWMVLHGVAAFPYPLSNV